MQSETPPAAAQPTGWGRTMGTGTIDANAIVFDAQFQLWVVLAPTQYELNAKM
jgi:hypothetical protein